MAFFSLPTMLFTLLALFAIGAYALLFRKRMSRRYLLIGLIILIWMYGFTFFLTPETKYLWEPMTIRAVQRRTNPEEWAPEEIWVAELHVNNRNQKMDKPFEGKWSYLPGENDPDHGIYVWYPAELAEEGQTDSISFYIRMGKERGLTLLGNRYSGIAEVTVAGETVVMDAFSDTEWQEARYIALPDTTPQALLRQDWERLPVAVAIFAVMAFVLFFVTFKVTTEPLVTSIKKEQFLFEILVNRDFTLKYKRTVLGMLWSIISPLVSLLVMWMVFKNILKSNIEHFVIYMFAGQVVFNYFNDATTLGMTSLVDNANIFTKVNVPKYMFLLSKNISSLINFGITLLLLLLFILVEGLQVTSLYIMLVYPILMLILFNIGMGWILSALFVFFRDMRYLWGVFTQLLMWISAIFYGIDNLPPTARNLFLFNPVYLFIRYFRKIILENTVPSFPFHMLMLGYTVLAMGLGILIYKKNSREFLYYV